MEIRRKSPFKKSWLLLLAAALGMIISCEPEDNGLDKPGNKEFIPVIYEVFEMNIQLENHAPIISKEPEDYLNCNITINGKGVADNYQGTALIRGRGNSSWLWYDKKPYRIKLDEKSNLLGLKNDSDWVLLANYRDPTDLMNVFGFEISDLMGLPFTNHTRFIEVTLNEDFIGLYQLTEQIEQGDNRVNIDEINGLLLSLDLDDGPGLSPTAGNNFSSSLFELPVSVKYPETPTIDQLYSIRADFALLENAINNYDYDTIDKLLDIPSFINYMIIQELVYNVEVIAPRSIFIFKDAGGKYTMGPSWDFDAGFDFDWSTMTTGHNFFNSKELVLGTDPGFHNSGVSGFFTRMFRNPRFVAEYKARWNEVRDHFFDDTWKVMEKYEFCLKDALARDYQRWPIDKNYTTEYSRMEDWLSKRVSYLTTVISNYPEGIVPTTKIDCGTLTCNVSMSYQLGYAQINTVNVDESSLLSMLAITTEQMYSGALRIIPLKTDGTEGQNNTNGVYGGWFEGDNNPGFWSNGHIYIEVFENLTEWACGLRAEIGYCSVGEKHTVRMQYQFTQGTVMKTVTINLNITIVD